MGIDIKYINQLINVTSKAALASSPDWLELITNVPAEAIVEVNKITKVNNLFIFPPEN